LRKKRLVLRRFPKVEPDILQLRHLRLMHALSRQRISFDDLLPLLQAADRDLVCPDLAALYLTGVLQLVNSDR
jgi:hypothetical protein